MLCTRKINITEGQARCEVISDFENIKIITGIKPT